MKIFFKSHFFVYFIKRLIFDSINSNKKKVSLGQVFQKLIISGFYNGKKNILNAKKLSKLLKGVIIIF